MLLDTGIRYLDRFQRQCYIFLSFIQIESRRQTLSQQAVGVQAALEQRIIEEKAGALAARVKGVRDNLINKWFDSGSS